MEEEKKVNEIRVEVEVDKGYSIVVSSDANCQLQVCHEKMVELLKLLYSEGSKQLAIPDAKMSDKDKKDSGLG